MPNRNIAFFFAPMQSLYVIQTIKILGELGHAVSVHTANPSSKELALEILTVQKADLVVIWLQRPHELWKLAMIGEYHGPVLVVTDHHDRLSFARTCFLVGFTSIHVHRPSDQQTDPLANFICRILP